MITRLFCAELSLSPSTKTCKMICAALHTYVSNHHSSVARLDDRRNEMEEREAWILPVHS